MNKIKKILLKNLIKFLIKLNNFTYEKISKYCVILENGIHPKHRIMKYHEFFLENIKESDNVLDIGCGNGFISYKISKKAKEIVGIDINPENIKIALKEYKANNIKYILGDITEYKFENKFDVIIMSNVLEHIKNRIDFLISLKDKADKFLIRVPCIERSWLDIYKKELGVEYRLDKSHYTEYTVSSFTEEMIDAGLKITNLIIKFGEIWAVVSN